MNVLIPDFEKCGGLLPVIAQDVVTREVLMVASTDRAGYLETLETGRAVYFSRNRWKRWKKGEMSGNVQIVHQVLIDCDGDAIIYLVEQKGGIACHTEARSCFYRDFSGKQLMPAPLASCHENLLVLDQQVVNSIVTGV